MISMARTLGAPETVPAGKPATSASSASCALVELALDVGDDVHDVAVAFQEEAVGDLDRADLGDAADIVAAEVEQHQVLGALLRVGEQLGRRAPCPRAGVAPRGRVPAMGRMVTSPSRTRTRISGLEPATEAAEIEVVEKGRGVDAAERAVEREGRQREGRLEALRQHHLEDVAGRDVVLRLRTMAR